MSNSIWYILHSVAGIMIILFLTGTVRRKQIFGSFIYGLIVSSVFILIKWPFAGYLDWLLGAKILTVFVLIGLGFVLLDTWSGKKLRKKKMLRKKK